jgi:hypothetical protein
MLNMYVYVMHGFYLACENCIYVCKYVQTKHRNNIVRYNLIEKRNRYLKVGIYKKIESAKKNTIINFLP